MKWKLSGLLVLLLLGLCLWWRLHRQNTKVVYETKIEKDGGFKATFDKKKGTLTIVRSDRRQAGSSNGARPGPISKSDKRVEQTDVLHVSRRAELIFDPKSGDLSVISPRSGWVREPGIAGFYSTEAAFRLGFDVQWGYYRQWGIVTGVSSKTSGKLSPRLYMAATYEIPGDLFTNTSIFVGIDNHKEVYLGLRIGL